MTDVKELLPCPFCGGSAFQDEVGGDPEADSNVGGKFIACRKCGATTALYFDRAENLVPAWNRRAHSAAVEGLVKAWSDLLATVHCPHPSKVGRIDVAPGQHRNFENAVRAGKSSLATYRATVGGEG